MSERSNGFKHRMIVIENRMKWSESKKRYAKICEYAWEDWNNKGRPTTDSQLLEIMLDIAQRMSVYEGMKYGNLWVVDSDDIYGYVVEKIWNGYRAKNAFVKTKRGYPVLRSLEEHIKGHINNYYKYVTAKKRHHDYFHNTIESVEGLTDNRSSGKVYSNERVTKIVSGDSLGECDEITIDDIWNIYQEIKPKLTMKQRELVLAKFDCPNLYNTEFANYFGVSEGNVRKMFKVIQRVAYEHIKENKISLQ